MAGKVCGTHGQEQHAQFPTYQCLLAVTGLLPYHVGFLDVEIPDLAFKPLAT